VFNMFSRINDELFMHIIDNIMIYIYFFIIFFFFDIFNGKVWDALFPKHYVIIFSVVKSIKIISCESHNYE
jgi:hypothetical protein